jgi:hypothetical protein
LNPFSGTFEPGHSIALGLQGIYIV